MIVIWSPCGAPEQEPVLPKTTTTTRRVLIYLAGPYAQPDPVENTHYLIRIADALLEAGFTPFVPHLNLLWHLVSPKRHETWLDYDRELLARCDVVLRIPGRHGRFAQNGNHLGRHVLSGKTPWRAIQPCWSTGATQETRFADELGIPVIRPRSADPADCVAAVMGWHSES